MALGQRHHRASRLARACATRLPAPPASRAKLAAFRTATRHAAPDDARQRRFRLLRRGVRGATVDCAPAAARCSGRWLIAGGSPTFSSSLPSSASTTTCIRCFRCARWSSAARRGAIVAARTATELAGSRAVRAVCGDRRPRRRRRSFRRPRRRRSLLRLRRARLSQRASRSIATLDKGALVVIGHYGPDVQYYIDRFGWEEDPAAWTPFDEESAIRKGARYFISIEDNRLRRNFELCAWLQRFPVRNPSAAVDRLRNRSAQNASERRRILAIVPSRRARGQRTRVSRPHCALRRALPPTRPIAVELHERVSRNASGLTPRCSRDTDSSIATIRKSTKAISRSRAIRS